MTDTLTLSSQTIQNIQSASSSFGAKDYLNISFTIINLAILCVTVIFIKKSPIDAVKTAEKLQTDRSNADRIYQNKFYVFASILGLRHALGWNENFVISINQISIVFHDNKKVLEKLKIFIDKHKTITNDQNTNEILKPLLNDLIFELAKDLNYSHVDNSLLDDFFFPQASWNRYLAEDYQNNEYVSKNQAASTNNVPTN